MSSGWRSETKLIGSFTKRTGIEATEGRLGRHSSERDEACRRRVSDGPHRTCCAGFMASSCCNSCLTSACRSGGRSFPFLLPASLAMRLLSSAASLLLLALRPDRLSCCCAPAQTDNGCRASARRRSCCGWIFGASVWQWLQCDLLLAGDLQLASISTAKPGRRCAACCMAMDLPVTDAQVLVCQQQDGRWRVCYDSVAPNALCFKRASVNKRKLPPCTFGDPQHAPHHQTQLRGRSKSIRMLPISHRAFCGAQCQE